MINDTMPASMMNAGTKDKLKAVADDKAKVDVSNVNTPKADASLKASVVPKVENAKVLNNQEQQHSHRSTGGECARCARIDQQIEEQTAAADRLKQNNDDLKAKISELSGILASKLEILKQRKNPAKKEKPDTAPGPVDPIKKEIETMSKKIFQAQKQLKSLEEKQEAPSNAMRVTEIKNEIAEKQQQLSKLVKENKLLEDLFTAGNIAASNNTPTPEQEALEKELVSMKGLIKNLRRDDRVLDKETTKQCEYLVSLEQKHKEVCQKVGVPASLNQERFELMQELHTENHKNKIIRQDQQEKQLQKKLGKLEINVNSYKKILNEIENKKLEKAETEFMQKREVEETQGRIKIVNAERDSLQLKLRDKEKELNIAIMKINELKRLTKHNALLPLVLESSKPSRNNNEFYLPLNRRQEIRREQKGVTVGSTTACSWDNSNELPGSKDYLISKITVWYKDFQIRGFSVEYKLKGGELVGIEGFCPASTEGLEEKVMQLRGPEYITSVNGYQNNLHIEYLRIVSSRGNYVLAGSDRNQAKCKRFEFEIRKEERPISFFGVVDKIAARKRKDDNSNAAEPEPELVLTSFGIEFKKKDTQNTRSSVALNTESILLLEDNEIDLYGDSTKRTPAKSNNNNNNAKRKVIDARNSKVLAASELDDESIEKSALLSAHPLGQQAQPQVLSVSQLQNEKVLQPTGNQLPVAQVKA